MTLLMTFFPGARSGRPIIEHHAQCLCMRSENMKQFQLGCVHQLGFVDQDVLAELRAPNPRFQEWLVKTLGQRDSDVKNFSVATQHAFSSGIWCFPTYM